MASLGCPRVVVSEADRRALKVLRLVYDRSAQARTSMAGRLGHSTTVCAYLERAQRSDPLRKAITPEAPDSNSSRSIAR
jgi:hypothetical protein